MSHGCFLLLVSLQDINMRKAFKSSTTQDQQVVSKSSVPNPVREMYNISDKPPPLNILSTYRSVILYSATPMKCALCTMIYSHSVYIGMITRRPSSSIQIRRTSLTCGRRRCCRTRRIRGKRSASRRSKTNRQFVIPLCLLD